MNKAISIIFLFLFVTFCSLVAQQTVVLDVSPSISKSIKGHKELQRDKYFNLAANVDEITSVISGSEQFDYYFKELEMTVGRKLGIVNGPVKWGNSVKEDVSRPGYADIDYMKTKMSPSDVGMDDLKSVFGSSQGLAAHENHNAYPSFMPKYVADGSDQEFPSNNLAAAELVSNILKYDYTDFKRPSYYELINEPDWRYWGDQRFFDYHLECKKAVDKLGLNTKVGGPCYSVSNFYKKEFGNLSQFTKFIDGTNFELDFYSFHTYDYMRWDGNDFVGSITSGLPLESVFDALAAYTFNEYDSEFKYVNSENGAYVSDNDNRVAAYKYIEDTYFPGGSGFDHEMKIRSIDNYIMVNGAITNAMVFMNHPHIVEKTVPFILLESSQWDPYYYSSLLVKENFDKNSSTWVESRLIDYFRFFKDVKGRRVQATCSDTDIQYHTFVDGNTLVCVMKNQSNVGGNISINIEDYDRPIKSAMLRRLKRNDDFTPSFDESPITDFSNISFSGQEGMVLFVTFEADVVEEKQYNEEIYYSKEVVTNFVGTHLFNVKTPNYETIVDATLRIGLSREAAKSKTVKIEFNDEVMTVPVENCADRITSDYYATTKIIKIPVDKLKSRNFVKVTFPDGKTGGIGSVIIRASEMETLASLESQKNASTMVIYPNPAKDKVTIKHQDSGIVELYNLNGKKVITQKVSGQTTSVSVENLFSGVYFMHFQSNNGDSDLQKIIVL